MNNSFKNISEVLTKMMKERGYQDNYLEIARKILDDREIQEFINQHTDQLDKEIILRSLSKLYEFIKKRDAYDSDNRHQVNYKPKLVLSYGYIDVAYEQTEEYAKEMAKLELARRVQLVSLPKTLKQADFNDYDKDTSERVDALVKAMTFTSNYMENPDDFHKGLYLTGPFGVGKTYLLACIANRLARSKVHSTLVHYPTFTQKMKSAIHSNTTGKLLEEINQSKILMIDDIGAETNSAWLRDDILGVILQDRMQNNLPTFFSSNFTMNELEQHLTYTGRDTNEPVKAKRIMERIKYLSQEVVVDGENRRNPE